LRIEIDVRILQVFFFYQMSQYFSII
jgi:hypothetical protein